MRGLYKLLKNVLAKDLKRVVGKVVLDFQYAFVEGHQILEVVPIPNEVIDSRLKSSIYRIVCKLDIKKAHDHIN